MSGEALLEVNGLRVQFLAEEGAARALDGVTFHVMPSETVGIVGESGSGKSVTALSILRLLPRRNARVVGGSIRFGDHDLLHLPEAAMRRIRGNRIAMIFQEPMTSLNPVHTIGQQIVESLRIQAGLSRSECDGGEPRRCCGSCGFPTRIADCGDYPHQLSGGMRQRAMIAMALACSPQLLIADEPTTALDVTIQAQILDLLRELKARTRRRDAADHARSRRGRGDLSSAFLSCMPGHIVEEANVFDIFDHPAHPYTRGLLQSIPHASLTRQARLSEIPGMVPDLRAPIIGCSFAPRCGFAIPICRTRPPSMQVTLPLRMPPI